MFAEVIIVQMPIPDDWNGVDFCKWSVCWPDSIKWKAILHGLIEQPSQGRFWDRDTGNIRDTQIDFKPAYDYNFFLKGVFMSCDDTNMVNAFNRIADSIALLASGGGNSTCCDSPSVVVNNTIQASVVQPVGGNTVPVYGSQSPLTVSAGEFPDGYNDLEEYLLDKCRKSYAIVGALVQALRNLAGISIFNAIALAGLIALAIPGAIVFPPFAIGIMVGLLITLVGAIGTLASVADEIEADIDSWACVLYTSDSTESIIGILADFMDGIIGALSLTGPVGVAVKAVMLVLMSSDTLNQLFSNQGMAFYPDADCSACSACLDIPNDEWTTESQIGSTVTVEGDWVRATSGVDAGTGITYAQMKFDFASPVNINDLTFIGRGAGALSWGLGWLTYQDVSSYPSGYSDAGGGVISDGDPFSESVGDVNVVRIVFLARVNPLAVPGDFDYFEWSDICVNGSIVV